MQNKTKNTMKMALTVEEFCAAYNVGRTKFYQLQAEQAGPTVKRVGKRLLIPVAEAERWLENLPNRNPEVA